jgi:hypothetical protein
VSQGATVYSDGVVVHSTAGHGGFHLDAAHNAKVHPALREPDGWYEEDCAWAAVAQALPELFTEYERRCADRTIRDWYPEAWEAIHSRPLRPGESHKKDRRDFECDHAVRWVVISAILSDHHPGMTECVTTLGGDRHAAEQRRYLVPSDEYDPGRFGFIVNEARHRLYDGPSSLSDGGDQCLGTSSQSLWLARGHRRGRHPAPPHRLASAAQAAFQR